MRRSAQLFLLLAVGHDFLEAFGADFALVLDARQGAKGRARPRMLPVEAVLERVEIGHQLVAYCAKSVVCAMSKMRHDAVSFQFLTVD